MTETTTPGIVEKLIYQLKDELPPVFALAQIDRLTGCAIRARSIHNLRSQGKIPKRVFVMDGKRKVLVIRDMFLSWWQGRLSSCDKAE